MGVAKTHATILAMAQKKSHTLPIIVNSELESLRRHRLFVDESSDNERQPGRYTRLKCRKPFVSPEVAKRNSPISDEEIRPTKIPARIPLPTNTRKVYDEFIIISITRQNPPSYRLWITLATLWEEVSSRIGRHRCCRCQKPTRTVC